MCKDGLEFFVNVIIIVLYDDDGVLCGFGKVVCDIID